MSIRIACWVNYAWMWVLHYEMADQCWFHAIHLGWCMIYLSAFRRTLTIMAYHRFQCSSFHQWRTAHSLIRIFWPSGWAQLNRTRYGLQYPNLRQTECYAMSSEVLNVSRFAFRYTFLMSHSHMQIWSKTRGSNILSTFIRKDLAPIFVNHVWFSAAIQVSGLAMLSILLNCGDPIHCIRLFSPNQISHICKP